MQATGERGRVDFGHQYGQTRQCRFLCRRLLEENARNERMVEKSKTSNCEINSREIVFISKTILRWQAQARFFHRTKASNDFFLTIAHKTPSYRAHQRIGTNHHTTSLYPANMNVDSTSQDMSPSPSPVNEANVPSGFILKLFQMVNGAPDEVITVSSRLWLYRIGGRGLSVAKRKPAGTPKIPQVSNSHKANGCREIALGWRRH